jgi:hypothetical protein
MYPTGAMVVAGQVGVLEPFGLWVASLFQKKRCEGGRQARRAGESVLGRGGGGPNLANPDSAVQPRQSRSSKS